MLDLDIRSGDRIGIIQGTNAENIVASIASAKIGALLVPFQDIKTDKDFDRYLQLFRPRALMMPTKIGKVDYYRMIREMMPEMRLSDEGQPIKAKKYPFLKRVMLTDVLLDQNLPGSTRFRDMMLYGPFGYYENPLRRVAMTLTPDAPSMILLNGKDINKAKPVVLSQRNLLSAGYIFGSKLGLEQGDRVIVPQYQNSTLGAVLGNYASLTHAATVVLPCEYWNPNDVLAAIQNEKATAMVISGTDANALMNFKDFVKFKFPSLRTIAVDETASADIIENIKSKFGVQQIVRYVCH